MSPLAFAEPAPGPPAVQPDRRPAVMGFARGPFTHIPAWEWLLPPRAGAGSLFLAGALYRATELPAPGGGRAVRLVAAGGARLTIAGGRCDCPLARRGGSCGHAEAVAEAYRSLTAPAGRVAAPVSAAMTRCLTHHRGLTAALGRAPTLGELAAAAGGIRKQSVSRLLARLRRAGYALPVSVPRPRRFGERPATRAA